MKTKQYISHITMNIVLAFGVFILLSGCDHAVEPKSHFVITWRGEPFDSAAQARFLHELVCPDCPPYHPQIANAIIFLTGIFFTLSEKKP